MDQILNVLQNAQWEILAGTFLAVITCFLLKNPALIGRWFREIQLLPWRLGKIPKEHRLQPYVCVPPRPEKLGEFTGRSVRKFGKGKHFSYNVVYYMTEGTYKQFQGNRKLDLIPLKDWSGETIEEAFEEIPDPPPSLFGNNPT